MEVFSPTGTYVPVTSPGTKPFRQELEVIIVRHAQSQYNHAQKTAGEALAIANGHAAGHYIEDEGVKYDHKYSDCLLTEEGLRQCALAAKQLENEDVGIVFTSPMRRALTTTHEIFKNHRSKPLVLVTPSMSEMIEDSGDIPGDILETQKMFPQFNFDAFKAYPDPSRWFLNEMGNNKHTEHLLKTMSKHSAETVVSYMKEIHPATIESGKEMQGRVARVKEHIKDVVERESRPGKVVLVGHGEFFYFWTAKTYNEKDFPKEATFLKNATPFPHTF